MSSVRLGIVYYSTYGTNHQMAEEAAEAARTAGAEVRLLRVRETAPEAVVGGQPAWSAEVERARDLPEVTPGDLAWANALLFSVPTRFGGVPSQMGSFFDTLGPLWMEGKLADKAVSAMTSAQNAHGGQEATLLSLYTTLMHWGALIVPPGYTDPSVFSSGGNPYGMSVTAGPDALGEEARAAIRHQARRLVDVAERLSRNTDAPRSEPDAAAPRRSPAPALGR